MRLSSPCPVAVSSESFDFLAGQTISATRFGRRRFASFIDLLRLDHESLNFRLHFCIISWHPVLVIDFCVVHVLLCPFYHSCVLLSCFLISSSHSPPVPLPTFFALPIPPGYIAIFLSAFALLCSSMTHH